MIPTRQHTLEMLKQMENNGGMVILVEDDGTVRYATGSALEKLGLDTHKLNGEIMAAITTAVQQQHSVTREIMSHEATFEPIANEGFVAISFRPIFPSEWSEQEYRSAVAALDSLKSCHYSLEE
jgi:hypothetical protein